MPALFPELFDFSIMAAVILRDAVGFYFVLLGERLLRKLRASTEGVSPRQRFAGYVYGVGEMIVGSLLVIGLFTQGAALGGIVLSGASLLFGIGRGGHASERHVQVLLIVMCVAVLFLGAGPFAYDLPL
jgi:uncharacterized membrane protein YphA (DoxX/SURF4 family)